MAGNQDTMLRLRPKAVSSKQGLMPHTTSSLPSPPTPRPSSPTSSSLFTSPRLLLGLSPKGLSYPEASMSPTSILEAKPFSPIWNPFFSDRNTGLGILDALSNDTTDLKSSKPESRRVLLGSELKVQIPLAKSNPISPTASVESPHSPIEFGVKTKNSQLALHSPRAWRSPRASGNLGSDVRASSPSVFTGCLSASEMELSEDYTCVISHGPNPRTTHIFNNCVVDGCGDDSLASRKENGFSADRSACPPGDFLSFCCACKKNLEQGEDIFMYRGEKGFCSCECRHQEILFDEGIENCSEDLYGPR